MRQRRRLDTGIELQYAAEFWGVVDDGAKSLVFIRYSVSGATLRRLAE
jgi:hypothetical protein